MGSFEAKKTKSKISCLGTFKAGSTLNSCQQSYFFMLSTSPNGPQAVLVGTTLILSLYFFISCLNVMDVCQLYESCINFILFIT
jgi:hypothetical protein